MSSPLLHCPVHPCLPVHLPLSHLIGRDVKLRPLQVEAQPCANRFDEALLQRLDGQKNRPIRGNQASAYIQHEMPK